MTPPSTHRADRLAARLGIEYKWIVAVVFVLGLFIDIMDTTIVNVAIPTLASEFNVTGTGIEWLVLGYLLSLAVWIPASGWIGDKFGAKRTFLFALFIFTVASVLCGTANSLGQMIAFRILQGVGGGMLTPVGTAMLFRAFPPQERARASTVLIVPTVIAPALGPIVGGLLIDNTSWRWIFYVNIPIGLIGLVFGALFLKESKEATAGKFDVPGFLFSGLGLAGVLYALSQAPDHGWLSPSVLLTGLGGLALFVLLVVIETRVDQPMLAFRLYRERMFRNSNTINTLSYGSFAAFLFLIPQFLQIMLGYSALDSGLATFPQALGIILVSRIVGRVYHTVGPRRLVTFGLIGCSLCSLPMAFVSFDVSSWTIRALMLGRGLTMAFAFVPLQAATYANITPADTGRASAIFSTQRQVSAALGVAILSTVYISLSKHAGGGEVTIDDRLTGFHWAFLGSAVLMFVGGLVAFAVLRDSDAASTMHPQPAKH